MVALARKLGDLPVSARLESEADPRARPGSEEARFRVAVGESHPDHVVTLYRFDVDGFSGEVLGFELLCEYALPLDAWRRLEQRIRKDGDAHRACEEFRPLAR